MVGREPERVQIEQMLDQVPSGPAGIALEGEPGIGKTTIWREAIGRARQRGYRVLATAPAEPDASLAFAGLGDLFDGIPDETLAALSATQRRALSVALLAEDDDAASPDPQVLPRAVLVVLRALAAQGSLVIAIDDEQWLDRASARVLAFALSRLRDEPIGVLLARRRESGGMLSEELARGFGRAGVAVVTVGPLDASSIHDLVVSGNGSTIPRADVRRIHEMSDGNPLYALAIARELKARLTGGRDVPIPRTLEDAIARRLEQLDARARDPLLVVAALSHPTLALIHAVLSDFTISDLDGAVTAGVVAIAGDRVSFTHPLLASTAYSRASPGRRRELHRVIAKVLDDEEQRARHLALGAETPDSEIAMRIELAGHAAARRGAPAVGGELIEHAARLTPAQCGEARDDRIISAAQLHLVGGDARRTRELVEALLPELAHGSTRARALLLLAQVRTDDSASAEVLLAQALDNAGDDHRVQVEIESQLSVHSFNRGDFAKMLVHAQAALDSAQLANDPGLLAVAIASQATAAFACGQKVELEQLKRAIEFEDSVPPGSVLPSETLAQILCWSDDYEAARPAHEWAIRRARERGDVYTTGFLLLQLAMIEWYAGNREVAKRHFTESEHLVRGEGEHGLDLLIMWAQTMFSAGEGKLDQANTRALEAMDVAEDLGDRTVMCVLTTVLASIDLWNGQPECAHDRSQRFRESFYSGDLAFLGALTLDLWSVDIEALIALGRLEEAQRVVDDLLERSQIAENPNAIAIAERCRGLLLAARGDVQGAIEAMDAAIAAHARRPLRPELARTLLEKGSLQRRAKQKTAARQTLGQALAAFEESGAQMWIERVRDELSRVRQSVETAESPASQIGNEERAGSRRVRRAFMFTDIVDSTPLVSVLGDDAWIHLLQWHDRTLRELFGSHLGEEVDHAGDGFFVAFERADAAVRCAGEIQRRLERHRRDNGFAPKVRIGVHMDEANYVAGNYHGHGVHVAARIGAQARGGEVLISRETLGAVGAGVRVGEVRTAQLKGVSRVVELVPLIWA